MAGAFARLPAADQEVLRLVAWEGMTDARAIGLVLGLSPTAVRTRVHRARRRLRTLLNEPDAAPAEIRQPAARQPRPGSAAARNPMAGHPMTGRAMAGRPMTARPGRPGARAGPPLPTASRRYPMFRKARTGSDMADIRDRIASMDPAQGELDRDSIARLAGIGERIGAQAIAGPAPGGGNEPGGQAARPRGGAGQ